VADILSANPAHETLDFSDRPPKVWAGLIDLLSSDLRGPVEYLRQSLAKG
jgi:hypothetical protein